MCLTDIITAQRPANADGPETFVECVKIDLDIGGIYIMDVYVFVYTYIYIYLWRWADEV